MVPYPMRSVGRVLISLTWAWSPKVDKPLRFVTHGQWDLRPTATGKITAGYHCPATGTKLYCSVREANVYEQLAQGCWLAAEWAGVERATVELQAHRKHTQE